MTTTPAVLEAASYADVLAKLDGILDGLTPGDPFSASHPDVQALVDAGQVPPQMLGTAFSALHRAGRIRRVDWHPMSHGRRNGGSAHTWEVIA